MGFGYKTVREFLVAPSTRALERGTKRVVEDGAKTPKVAKVAKFNATKKLFESDTFKSTKNGTKLTADQFFGLKKRVVGAKKINNSTFEITKKKRSGKELTYKITKDNKGNIIQENKYTIKKFEMDKDGILSKTVAMSLTHWKKYKNLYLIVNTLILALSLRPFSIKPNSSQDYPSQ